MMGFRGRSSKCPDTDSLAESLDMSILESDIHFDARFLDRPADIALIAPLRTALSEWLVKIGVPGISARSIADRLPTYFVYALNRSQ
jgi:hypothetical protein